MDDENTDDVEVKRLEEEQPSAEINKLITSLEEDDNNNKPQEHHESAH